MDKRPPNPRRLSRKLFSKKVEIKKPYTGWTTPQYVLGEEVDLPALRSDIGSFKSIEGAEFATFEAFGNAVRRGHIPNMLEFTRKKKEPTYDDYKKWRKVNR